MEKLKTRAYCLAGIIGLGGVFAHIAPPARDGTHDEKWMDSHSLSEFENYRMVPNDDPSKTVTYRMDKDTYEILGNPGIICRELTNGFQTFDVVLISSQDKDSFHDPRICFGAQGWNLDDESLAQISTSRGEVPFTVARISSSEGQRWAAFAYRDPDGFVNSTNRLKLDLFTYSLMHSKPAEGVFYRFIGLSPEIDRSALLKFIGAYLSASERFSHGYF